MSPAESDRPSSRPGDHPGHRQSKDPAWVMRTYAGHSSASASNELFRRNLAKGHIVFAAYLGNAVRYDVDLGQGVPFKLDIRDPWHHKQLAMGTEVVVSFEASSTVAMPAEA